jgi:hypothetical protein
MWRTTVRRSITAQPDRLSPYGEQSRRKPDVLGKHAWLTPRRSLPFVSASQNFTVAPNMNVSADTWLVTELPGIGPNGDAICPVIELSKA